MNHSPRGILATVATLAALGFGAAQAAPVTWGSPTDIGGDSDVSTNGSLVGAYNFGSASATTVNGVLFNGLLIGAPQVVSVTMDGVHTLAISPERDEHTLANFATGSAVSGSSFLALSVAYQALLGSSAGSSFADRENFLTLGGLTIGQTYEFQAWFNDSTTEGEFGFGLGIGDAHSGEYLRPSTQKDANDKYILGGTGQFVIGTFVADAATKELGYARGEIPGGINGFQLRAIAPLSVPEPGSLALVGLATLGAALARRRPRRA